MARERALTVRRQAFCVALAANPSNATQAARVAGFKGSDAVLAVTATRLRKDPRIKAEVARLRAELSADAAAAIPPGAAMNRAEAILTLSSIARDKAQPVGGRVRAVRELGLLEGWYGLDGDGDAPSGSGVTVQTQVVVVVDNGRGPA